MRAVPGARPADDGVRLRAGAGAQPRRRRRDQEGRATTSAAMAGAGSSISSSSEAEEREHIRQAPSRASSARSATRPLGWYCRYGPSVNTRRLRVEEGGFLYDCDCYDDELPYWTRPSTASRTSSCPIRSPTTTANSCPARRHRRPTGSTSARRLRHALRGGRDAAEDDVGRHAHAPHRPPRPRRRAAALLDHVPEAQACGSPAASTSPSTGTSSTRRQPDPAVPPDRNPIVSV